MSDSDPATPSHTTQVFENLREWRLAIARQKGVPAFRILSDRVLFELCEHLPADSDALLQVPGIGPKLAAKYGAALLERIGRNTRKSLS